MNGLDWLGSVNGLFVSVCRSTIEENYNNGLINGEWTMLI